MAPILALSPHLLKAGKSLNRPAGGLSCVKVKFHDGSVQRRRIFSAERVRADGSDLKTRIASDTKVVKVDNYTVDFVTSKPNPILHVEWATWYIMSKSWAEKNNAVKPQSVTAADEKNYATSNANGTGPFKIVSHEPDVKSVAEVNGSWWDNPEHNVTKFTFTPIGSDATRVAALLGASGYGPSDPGARPASCRWQWQHQYVGGPELRPFSSVWTKNVTSCCIPV